MLMAEDTKDTKTEDIQDKSNDIRYPPIEVAEARIKQALLRYKVTVERVTPTSDKEKVRL